MNNKNNNIPLTSCFSIIKQNHFIFLNKILEKEEVTAGQTAFLIYILYNEKSCQEDIAKYYKMDKGAVARGVRKLEDLNMISKEIDENNRRKCRLTLTEKGHKIAKKLIKIQEQWENDICSDIDISKEKLKEIIWQITINTIKINKKMED